MTDVKGDFLLLNQVGLILFPHLCFIHVCMLPDDDGESRMNLGKSRTLELHMHL